MGNCECALEFPDVSEHLRAMSTLVQNGRGAALMTASMAAFTINDAFVKALSAAWPLDQILVLRGLGSAICLAVLALSLGSLRFRASRRDWMLVMVRSLSEVAAAYFFLTALINMPLANATAILQAVPLAVTLAGAIVLRERVGWRRFSAILVGFGGVMLIVRPASDGFNIFAAYALLAVLCVTVRDIATRQVSADMSSLTMAVVGAVTLTVLATLASPFSQSNWQPLSLGAMTLLTGSMLSIVMAYYFSVAVMRTGEISFVAPFRYTALLWALALGFVVFGDWPDLLTSIGAVIVVATGIFTFLRERRLQQT
ncbi:MAG: DMT family transporter [Pseudomonadota bacterium]